MVRKAVPESRPAPAGRRVELVSVDDRLPDGYTVPLLCIYPNGNEVVAMGYHDGQEWQIDYSDDHPQPEDIKFWIDIH